MAEGSDPTFEQAMRWLLRFDAGDVSESDRKRFDQWLADDPAHAEAWRQAENLWGRFEILKPELERFQRKRQIRRRSVLGGMAALLVVPTAFVLTRNGVQPDFVTGIGERRQFTLADGSVVELGSRSALTLAYTDDKRTLILHEGQGFFQVAPDPLRPFVVEAAGGTITALGTAFDVKQIDEEVTVTVLEHSVAVRRHGRSLVVKSGWQVHYDANGVASPDPADLVSAMGWRNDRLVFDDVPLRLVLRELERYRPGPIVLADSALGELSVTAIFDTAEAGQALGRIARTMPIEVLDIGGMASFVYRR